MTWRGKKENVEVILAFWGAFPICQKPVCATETTIVQIEKFDLFFKVWQLEILKKRPFHFESKPKWLVFHRVLLNGTDISSWFFQPERLDYLERLSSFFGWKFRKSAFSISFITDFTGFLDKWKASLVTLAEDNVNNDNFLINLIIKTFHLNKSDYSRDLPCEVKTAQGAGREMKMKLNKLTVNKAFWLVESFDSCFWCLVR